MIGDTYVIGLVALAQSGKDTTATYMSETLNRLCNQRSLRYAYADSLKAIYAAAQRTLWFRQSEFESVTLGRTFESFGVDFAMRGRLVDFLGNLFKEDEALANEPYVVVSEESKKRHRKNLIALGCFVREHDPDFWMNIVKHCIEQDKPDFAIITDLRFENEAKIVDELIEVIRPGVAIVRDANGEVDQSERFAYGRGFMPAARVSNHTDLFDLQQQAVFEAFNVQRRKKWAMLVRKEEQKTS